MSVCWQSFKSSQELPSPWFKPKFHQKTILPDGQWMKHLNLCFKLKKKILFEWWKGTWIKVDYNSPKIVMTKLTITHCWSFWRPYHHLQFYFCELFKATIYSVEIINKGNVVLMSVSSFNKQAWSNVWEESVIEINKNFSFLIDELNLSCT